MIAITLLCAICWQAAGIVQPAYAIMNTDEMDRSVGKLITIISQHRIFLYMLLANYYEKFGKWPSSQKELEVYYLTAENKTGEEAEAIKKMFNPVDKDGKATAVPVFTGPKDIFSFAPYKCRILKNGDLLIEGKIHKELEKAMTGSGISKCYFSMICHADKNEYSFQPSPQTIGNREYLNMPVTLKKAAPAKK